MAAAEEPVAAAEEPAVAAEEPAVVAEEPEVWLNWWVYFVLVQKWIYESSTFPTFLVRLRWYFNLISKTDTEEKVVQQFLTIVFTISLSASVFTTLFIYLFFIHDF